MPTFKNIRVKMKNGKSRLQRVQVLASGKYKFVKNTTKSRTTKRKTTRKAVTRRRKTVVKKRNGGGSKMFRTLGTAGAMEDFAWGFGGLMLMGANNPVSLPAIRLVQGVQGHVLGRTGKGRMVYALIDLADLVIAGQANVTSIFDSIKQLTKISSIAG